MRVEHSKTVFSTTQSANVEIALHRCFERRKNISMRYCWINVRGPQLSSFIEIRIVSCMIYGQKSIRPRLNL